MFRNEITFKDHPAGMAVAHALLRENYVVLLSYEEDLLVLDYEWSESADRNDVIFMQRCEYEEELDKIYSEVKENVIDDIKKGYIKI